MIHLNGTTALLLMLLCATAASEGQDRAVEAAVTRSNPSVRNIQRTMRILNREVAAGESVGLAQSIECEVNLDLLCVRIEVVQLVALKGLQAAVSDAIGKLDVAEILVHREGQVPQVLRVQAVPDL